jgi:hypothetical protein
MLEEIIKNIHIQVKKDPLLLIKGKVGFQTIVKKIVCNNKTTKTNTINIYTLDKEKKHYSERNTLIVPNSRLELLKHKSLVLTKKDRIFVECIKETEIDIVCEYIEKLININDVRLIFTDQYGENVENITHYIENSPFELNRKIIRINNHKDFVENLEPIEYEINNNQVKFFKNNNTFEIISEYCVNDLGDYFQINLFQNTYLSINDVYGPSFLKVSIIQENEKWRIVRIINNLNNYYFTIKINIDNIIWNVNHNLDTQYLTTTIINLDNKMIISNDLKFISNNNFIITFKEYIDGRIVVNDPSKSNTYIFNIETPSTTWNIQHNLGVQYFTTSFVDLDNKIIIPDKLEFINENNLMAIFSKEVSGRIIIIINTSDSYTFIQEIATNTWNITHNLNSQYVIPIFIDSNNEMILPSDVEFIDNNTLITTFPTTISGFAIINKGITIESNQLVSNWYNSGETITLIPDNYEIEFEEFGEATPLNYSLEALKNNFYDFSFDLENEVINQTEVSVLKSDFILNDDFLGIKWRIINLTGVLTYNDSFKGNITPGTYQIEIQGINEYFETILDQINIYENQKTIYKINDELIKNNNSPVNYMYPERLTINLNVIRKPILSVSIEPSGVDAHWRLIDLNGVKTDWIGSDLEIKINPEIYSIEFEDLNGYTKPSIYKLPIINSKGKKIKAIYLKNLQNLLTIDFIIPNKYRDYLSWCLVKPDNINEQFIVNWNNDIYYSNYLYQGNYQLKIREVVFQESSENIIYSFEDGVLINNKIIIEGKIIDICLNQDITINKTLIVETQDV